VDVELGDAVHAFKVGEPVEWCFACSGHKLQELGTFLAREPGDGTGKKKEISLHRSTGYSEECSPPKPLNLWTARCVVVILCVGLPIVNVDIGQAGNEQLELLLIENGNELCGDDVVETSKKIFELIVDRTCQAILGDQLDVLLLVFLSNRNVAPILDEVDDPGFTKVFRYHLHKVSR
jgi:hypothetical protein